MNQYSVFQIQSDNDKSKWNTLCQNSINSTIFHTSSFLAYHQKPMPFHHLGIKSSDNLVAVVPGAIINNRFVTPFGASYGGLIHSQHKLDKLINLNQAWVDFVHKMGLSGINITLPPLIYNRLNSQLDEYALSSIGLQPLTGPATSVIVVPSNSENSNWLKLCHPSVRRAIKKAQKAHLEIKYNSPSKNYYQILVKNKQRNDSQPVHTEAEIHWLCKKFKDKIFFINAYLGKKEIGGFWLIQCNPRVLLAFYIYLDYEFQNLRVIDFLIYEITLFASQHGIKYFDLGVSEETVNGIVQPSLSLINFKMKYASRLLIRPKFEINF